MNGFCKNCDKLKQEHIADIIDNEPTWCIKSGRELYNFLCKNVDYKSTRRITSNISYNPLSNIEYLEEKYEESLKI